MFQVNTEDGKTALMCAADEGHLYVVRNLLDRGADVEVSDTSDWTALTFAIEAEDVETVQLLAPPVTSNKLGNSLVRLARSKMEITSGIAIFITKCAGEREHFLEGIREATQFANHPMIEVLLKAGDRNWLSANTLSDLTNLAIMSDNPDMCKTILSWCGEHHQDVSQRWVHLASERRNVTIQKLLDPEYHDQSEVKKEKLRDAVIEKKADILDLTPKSEEFPYNRPMDQVLSLLDVNDSVSFEELLNALHMPEVHYKSEDEEKCSSY